MMMVTIGIERQGEREGEREKREKDGKAEHTTTTTMMTTMRIPLSPLVCLMSLGSYIQYSLLVASCIPSIVNALLYWALHAQSR